MRTALGADRNLFRVSDRLTDRDLKDLGVVLGDRRKMLRALRSVGVQQTPARIHLKKTAVPQGPVAHTEVAYRRGSRLHQEHP